MLVKLKKMLLERQMRLRKSKQDGFTLIELMIVVAIIGILASIAIPAYQDYTAKAQVSEAFSLASAAKTAVSLYHAESGSFPTTNTMAGLSTATDINGEYVTSVTVGAGGALTILFAAPAVESGNSVILTPTDETGSISWKCSSASIKANHLPNTCTSTAT
jgi:type IV pilus assembly protein PilA